LVASRHKDAHFLLVGNASSRAERQYEAKLRENVKSLGIQKVTHFLGYRPDVQDLLPLLTISVSPSTTEAFGRPAAEAAACEVPTVVAATDGLKEIVVDGRTGRVVPPLNVEALADAIGMLLSDPGKAKEMGRSGRERVISRFSSAIHAQKMRDLFQEMMNSEC
jgi:glycosyltransferase involved in cell wall biosynthesis